MHRLNAIIAGLALAGMTLMLQRPGMAQFEISPDHFPDADHSSAGRTALPNDRYSTEIGAVQQELESYYAAIRSQTEIVNRAQEQAAGAGGMGDSAYIFIDEYVRQQRELDRLKKELAPVIVLAQSRLEALKQQQARLTASAIARTTGSAAPPTRKRVHQHGVLIAAAPKMHK